MGSGRLAVTVLLLLGAAAVVLVSLEPVVTIRSSWGFVARGAVCVICILGYAAIPWTLLSGPGARGPPLDAPIRGVCAGAAPFLSAAAAVRIACPIDEALHLLT